jgi:hypothetical protein
MNQLPAPGRHSTRRRPRSPLPPGFRPYRDRGRRLSAMIERARVELERPGADPRIVAAYRQLTADLEAIALRGER